MGFFCLLFYFSEYTLVVKFHADFTLYQVTWSDIAGLDDVITDLKDTVILPIKKKHLFGKFQASTASPKGILKVYICGKH